MTSVQVNGQTVDSTFKIQSLNAIIVKDETGTSVSVRWYTCKRRVVYDGETLITRLDARPTATITGLCGNCNGRADDDYKDKNGRDLSKYPDDIKEAAFVDGHRVSDLS